MIHDPLERNEDSRTMLKPLAVLISQLEVCGLDKQCGYYILQKLKEVYFKAGAMQDFFGV